MPLKCQKKIFVSVDVERQNPWNQGMEETLSLITRVMSCPRCREKMQLQDGKRKVDFKCNKGIESLFQIKEHK